MDTISSPKILIVDDRPANLKALRVLMAPIDAEVIEATSGNEALSLTVDHRFALALLDVDMPVMDGFELARMFRSVKETSTIPLIFVTAAFKDQAHRTMGYAAGGVDYIEKPVDAQVLLSKITIFLELYQRNEKILRLNHQLEERIAAQSRVEEALRQSEERYHDLYDHAPDMFASVSAQTALILECNQTLCTKLGYTREELIGRPIFEVYHPECLNAAKRAFDTFVKTGVVNNADLILQQKEGNPIPVALHVTSERDSEGQIVKSRSSWRDVSERKRIEKSLKTLEKAVDQSPVSIVITDARGAIEYVNPKFSAVTGYTFQEAIGQNPRILQSGHTTPQAYQTLWKTLESGQEWSGEFLNKKKDGSTYWENALISSVQNNRGEITHYIAVKEDVTLRRIHDQRLKMALEASNDGIWDWNIETGHCFFSLRWTEMIGLSTESFAPSYESWMGRIHPDDQADLLLRLNGYLAGREESFESEHRIKSGQGNWIWVRTKGKVTEKSVAGKPIRMVGTQSDITLIKQWVKSLESSNRKLKESEENYRSLVDNVPGAVYRCAVDQDWTIFFISGAIFDLTGYPAEAFVNNQSLSFASIIHPEDAKQVQRSIQRAIHKRESFEVEYRIRHKNGTLRWVSERGYGTQYQGGRARWLDGIIVDISDHRESELVIKQAYQTQKVISAILQISLTPLPLEVQLDKALSLILPLKGVADQASGAIFLLDSEKKELTLSVQQGIEVSLLAQCSKVPLGYCLCGRAAKQREIVFASYLDERHEIRSHSMEDHGHYCVPILSDSQVLGVLCLYLEAGAEPNEAEISPLTTIASTLAGIIQRNRLDESLRRAKSVAEEATQAKSAFLAAMSHDIRTPMNAILGMGEVLKESPLNTEQQKSLKILTHAGENLLALINDILDLSKIEAGQLQLEKVSFDLHELLDGIQQIFCRSAKEKGLVLEMAVQGRCPQWVVGDPQRLRQVLINLLGNAIKFTEQGTIVTSIHQIQDALYQITVSDTGIGISTEQVGHIFNPFRQAEDSTTRRFGGTGLGLSICSRLLHAMGSEIKVESVVGQGSQFYFSLLLPSSSEPLLEESQRHSAHLEKNRSQTEERDQNFSMKILLVDDADDNRMVISAFLRDTNYRITEAINGEEAVKAFKTEPFDFILMDVRMPVLGGIDATKQIRAWEKEQGRPPTPIVALTANAMREDRDKTVAAGFDMHLSKPVGKARLFEILNRFYPAKGASNASDLSHGLAGAASVSPVAEAEQSAIDRAVLETLQREMGGNIDHLIEKFHRKLPGRIENIVVAIEKREPKALADGAHLLKGGAGTLGASQLEELCRLLEKKGIEGAFKGADALILPLKKEGDRVLAALENVLNQETAP
ncbi:MAG: PAS domain S-box protein [Magnetococcales bacterium]|nr:PAS domain S-box protein [Magnetococcales bacterium]